MGQSKHPVTAVRRGHGVLSKLLVLDMIVVFRLETGKLFIEQNITEDARGYV
jgi:hypothetical protein